MRKTTTSLIGATLAGAVLVSGLALSNAASATPLTILSYDMMNGNNGKYDYFDEEYTGTITPLAPLPGGFKPTENAWLSGGTGRLTDGIIATDRWDVDSEFNDGGRYVGWAESELDIPHTITFHIDGGAATVTDYVTIWVDDADGVGTADQPDYVTINGTTFDFIDPTLAADVFTHVGICDNAAECASVQAESVNTLPFSNTFFGNWIGDTLTITFGFENEYIMVSEIELGFTPPPVVINPTPPSPVPPPTTQISEPGTLALFGLGLMGLGFARRRKSA